MANETQYSKIPKMAPGQKYNRLLTIKFVLMDSRYHKARWKFRCDCGSEIITFANVVRSGKTKSCGCIGTEAKIKHGRAGTSIYTTWNNIRRRCRNKESKYYGARGITVCDRWYKFENFLEDMGEHPGNGFSIDRIDNDGNYEPGNCRWATVQQQANNKRNSRAA